MCGLLAGSGKINHQRITALGCLNSGRGKDSAGIAWHENGDIKVSKIAKNPLAAFPMDLCDDIASAVIHQNVIGHTRAATTGAVTSDNAHPFLIDGVVFAHNGIISNHAKFGEYVVDSQSLIHGIKKRDFSEYDGSIALVWIADGKMFAFRNGNPLYRGVKDGALYLASDDDYLKAIECQKIRALSEAHIYEIAGCSIVGSKKVPINKSYATRSNVYVYNGRSNISYGWSNGDSYWPVHAVETGPRPPKSAICSDCGHLGSSHTSIMGNTGKWGCFFNCPTICKCNAFVEKKEERKIGFFSQEKCWCGHIEGVHRSIDGKKECVLFKCKCLDFRKKSTTLVDCSKPVETSWGDLPVSTLCDCAHELEYHNLDGNRHKCAVQKCFCDFFWPIDTTPKYAGPQATKPGWCDTWRVTDEPAKQK